jgi:RNA polymerase sigma factor (sigma-70 family)
MAAPETDTSAYFAGSLKSDIVNSSPSKKKDWELNQESLDNLLGWLSGNREEAGRKYEEVRRRLVKIFICRGCIDAEDLADETIKRVMRKVLEIVPFYVGDPALYFLGVAHRVCLEHLRRKPVSESQAILDQPEEREQIDQCLGQCMQTLGPEERDMIIQYFKDEKGAKIDHRRELADRLGMSPNALRIRVHRTLKTLEERMTKCLRKESRDETDVTANKC